MLRWITRQIEEMRVNPLGFYLRVSVNENPLKHEKTTSSVLSVLLLIYVKKLLKSHEIQKINPWHKRAIDKRIGYILEGNLLEKSVKRPFCCTVSILQVYFTYLCYITFWALEHNFIENLKLMLKENQIMK